jgi:phenylalanyl-tRNA synthetase beta chain
MQLSEAWLREWIDPPWDSATLATRLTMAGFEVEGRTRAAADFDGVVVGEIVECTRHPKADKLSVCRVTTDGRNQLQIVCGASNARAGLRTAVALTGAQLPGGVTIKRAQLREVESMGMLCSARELGLGENAEGILELPDDARIGKDLRSFLALDDTILALNLTPNRGDTLSVRGIAREVAAIAGRKLAARKQPKVAAMNAAKFAVTLTATRACPKFVSRVIRTVDAGRHSPLWLRERLRRSGLRPINPIVDVTNYVMLELGTPMHAYDLGKLRARIDVRFAKRGERLRLLDGREIELDAQDLVIADGEGAVGLAGVMGGERTAVDESTTDVLLEVAYFSPEAIRASARRHALITDAAQRFERGVDPGAQEESAERAAQLLGSITGGEPGPTQVTAASKFLPRPAAVTLRSSQLKRLLGVRVADARVKKILLSLGMAVKKSKSGWSVTPPPYRFDVAIEADLIEEVGRIVGYDGIPEIDAPIPQRFPLLTEGSVSIDRWLLALADRGYQEAITYSFVDPKLQQQLFPDSQPLLLSNPIATDLAAMRVSLWPGLIAAARENLRRQQDRVRLFESGRRFALRDGTLHEAAVVAGIAMGAALPEQWGEARRAIDFYDVKADVEALLDSTGRSSEFTFEADSLHCLHPGRTARIRRGEEHAGWIGQLHPEQVRMLDLTYTPLLFELETSVGLRANIPVFEEISRFPAIRRDLAVVVDEAVPLAAIREHVSVGARSLLRDLRVFDIYRGKGVDSGRKSVALGLIFQETSRTLTDHDADQIVAAVADRLRRELNATIRDQ